MCVCVCAQTFYTPYACLYICTHSHTNKPHEWLCGDIIAFHTHKRLKLNHPFTVAQWVLHY